MHASNKISIRINLNNIYFFFFNNMQTVGRKIYFKFKFLVNIRIQ